MKTRPAHGALLAVLLAAAALVVQAAPIVPRDADEVVEVLPAAALGRSEERRLRRELSVRPDDAALATAVARRYLEQARRQGDPRYAGLALAALQRWDDSATAPIEVLLLQATLDQHLHAFEDAASRLERLLERDRRQAQAWLTLATVRRVQGRYDDSDAACRGLAAAGAALHAAACQAENQGLRGDSARARASLQRLLALPRLEAGTRGWLATTLAELEQRSGRPDAARAAWLAALQAEPEGYGQIGFSDFLLEQGRATEAWAVLEDAPRSDAVQLRRAIAAQGGAAPDADAEIRQVRERLALASLRPDVAATHARELAMFALRVEHDAPRALGLARENLKRQREPVDLLLLAQAARAAGSAEALREAAQLRASLGLVDQRLAALL